MKKLFLILVIIPLFWGCEKYEMISEPPVAGTWKLANYHVVKVSSISSIEIIKNDTICINAFNNQSFVSGNILMKQNYNQTSPERRFVIGESWYFNGPSQATSYDLIIPDNPEKHEIKADFIRPYLSSRYEKMVFKNLTNGSYTTFTFQTYALGSLNNTMDVLSPPIVTDLYLSNGKRDKAVTVQILLHFMR
jgi:hypothetical protein